MNPFPFLSDIESKFNDRFNSLFKNGANSQYFDVLIKERWAKSIQEFDEAEEFEINDSYNGTTDWKYYSSTFACDFFAEYELLIQNKSKIQQMSFLELAINFMEDNAIDVIHRLRPFIMQMDSKQVSSKLLWNYTNSFWGYQVSYVDYLKEFRINLNKSIIESDNDLISPKVEYGIKSDHLETIPQKIVLLQELGFICQIKSSFPINNQNLSKLIGHIINENPDSVRPFLSYLDNPNNTKNNPRTNKSLTKVANLFSELKLSNISQKLADEADKLK